MKTPMADAIDLVADGNHQAIANYIAKARQNERWAKFFEWMMLNDCSAEYSDHVQDMLNDKRYDKTYLCALIEKAQSASRTGD